MGFDWLSDENIVLMNPRFPASDQKKLREMLQNEHDLKGHICLATSGSSQGSKGFPKWVLLTKEGVLHSAAAVNQHLAVSAQDRWIHALPDFHVGGLGIWARSWLSHSSVSVFAERWNPQTFCQFVRLEKGTLAALVPTQIFDLVAYALPPPKSLRAIVVGGGKLHEGLYAKARELGWNLLPSYGLTECASQVATAPLSSLAEYTYPQLTILSHVKVEIREEKITLASPSLLTAYILKTEQGIQRVDPKVNGIFQTEDRGIIDEETLTPLGRTADFIKISGENVGFSRLEALLEMAKMACLINGEAVLVAWPDARLGHAVHLVLGPGISSPEALISYFNTSVMPYERIREVHYVSQIPRSALGKLLRYELNEILARSSP
jgi:O-succinylbenzoic acid--CoA ligase